MNEEQAEALKHVVEAGHPDAATTVTAEPDGAEITISGTEKAPSLSGPRRHGDVVLRLGKNSPFLLFLLAATQASRAPTAGYSLSSDDDDTSGASGTPGTHGPA
jgi:hypothetical protein